MPKMKTWNGTQWIELDAKNSETVGGKSISELVQNSGGVPSILSGTSLPLVGESGRLFIDETDKKIYRDNGTGWDLIGGSDSIDWNSITGKPVTFPPSSHTHDDRYYTESEIDNTLKGKATRVNLSSQVQTTSYHRSVIALCEVTNDTYGSSYDSYSMGTITFHRTNGLSGHTTAIVAGEKKYNTTTMNYHGLHMGYYANNIRPCTFTYNSVKYGGIEFYFSAAELGTVEFYGNTNFNIFGLDYYNTSSNTAINAEVNNSLNFNEINWISEIYYNNNKVQHEGNEDAYNNKAKNSFVLPVGTNKYA